MTTQVYNHTARRNDAGVVKLSSIPSGSSQFRDLLRYASEPKPKAFSFLVAPWISAKLATNAAQRDIQLGSLIKLNIINH
jgi:hypothetical protein